MAPAASSSTSATAAEPRTVAWISEYPIEWMADLPESLRAMRRQHPATWMPVLLGEFERQPGLALHVIVLRTQAPADVTFTRNGVTFHVLRASGKARLLSLFWWDTLLLRRRLRHIRPDVVHAWGVERGAAMVATRLGRPNVITMQGIFGWYRQQSPELNAYERFIARLEPFALRRAKVVTTESNFAVNYLQARYPQMLIHQAEHAPNWTFHQTPRRPQTHPARLLHVGSMGFRKGTDLLFRALAALAGEFDFQLVCVSGQAKEFLAPLQASLPAAFWQRVEFKDSLTPAQVAAELTQATLLVLPTRADTSPNSVKEAAVVGVPVVATDVGGIPDYIKPGENGLLCPAGDLGALQRTLREALTHPRFSQGQVRPETWQAMRAYLSPTRMARRFNEAYQLAIDNHRR